MHVYQWSINKTKPWKKWLVSRVYIIITLEVLDHEKLEFSSIIFMGENK